MNKSLRVLLALVAAQALAVGVYWLVERQRADDHTSRQVLSRSPPQQVSGSVPKLSLMRRSGHAFELPDIERPTLLHFWATWCEPCLKELPALLSLADAAPVDVIAIALDRDWAAIDHEMPAIDTSNVVLGDAKQIESALRIHALPVTYLVQPGGKLQLRFDGARAWHDPGFQSTWLPALQGRTPP